ncbi:MAG: ABC-F family ATP-binding cassette domain-containing protein [Desulfobacteraceae bacterium]|jgi:ATP-binding cassette subfamily F protein 3
MSLVTLLNLSLAFSGKELFHEINVQVEPGQHIGLVGPNGSGKTTLLRLLVGEVTPDHGEIRIAKGTRIGYLPQDIYETLFGTLRQSLLDAIPSRNRLRLEMTNIERSLKDNPDQEAQEKTAARLAEIHQELIDLDARFPTHKAEKILLGLGFKSEDFEKPLASLSGGWKMRAALGRLLYQNPDLLLLDEPTNHLDLPSVRWLEEFLQGYKGAMILICHDRDFLNRQIERCIGLEPEGMRVYKGNYDLYLKAREEERKTLEARARNQEQKVKEARRFIERFRAKASKARQAQSKIKLLDKMALIETHKKEKRIHFSFPKVSRSGRVVVTIEGVSKGFDHKILYKNLNLRVLRGERIAIIGPNGAGKTTLLRMVAGELDPDQGELILGHGVSRSYYAQHHSEMLDPNKTIVEEVYQVVPHESVSFVKGVCGAFLFPGKEVEKAVGILSGGERARVSLAKILVKPGNLMVMDEPTNHLDIVSSEILIDALAEFNGTLIFVSHNQSFVNRLATKIWDIRDQSIVAYPGTLYEYFDHLSMHEKDMLTIAQQATMPSTQSTPRPSLQSRKMKRREKAERRRFIAATLKPIHEALRQLEERIDDLEKRKKEIEKRLSDPGIFKDKKKSLPLLNEYGEVRKKLERLMGRWEYKQEELASAKKDLAHEQSN